MPHAKSKQDLPPILWRSDAPKWCDRAYQWLGKPAAPRALTYDDFKVVGAIAHGSPPSDSSLLSAIRHMEKEGVLKKARKGLWLNSSRKPAGRLEDVLSKVQRGSVASLHSVLGKSGAHNNPSVMAFGVCPHDGDPRELMRLPTRLGDVRVYGLPKKFFDGGARAPWRSKDAPYASFVAEKALLDWIYLGKNEHCHLPEPNPSDVDLDMLDLGKADLWARDLNMADKLVGWLERHPRPNEQAKGIIDRAKQDGLVFESKLAKRRESKGPSIRDLARARGMAR